MQQNAMELRKQVLPEDDPNTAQSMRNTAEMHDELGQFNEAMALEFEALEFRKRVLPRAWEF